MERLTVGQITSAHGVRGEVRVFIISDFPERFNYLKQATLSRPKGKQLPEPVMDVKIESVKQIPNFAILKFEGVDDRDAAEKLRNLYVQVPRSEAHPLPEGNFYISDIVGMSVYTGGNTFVGIVDDVFRTGSNDVYSVAGEQGKVYLIPAIKDVVKKIDAESKSILIEPMPGLLD